MFSKGHVMFNSITGSLITLLIIFSFLFIAIDILITHKHRLFFRPDTEYATPHTYSDFYLPKTGCHVIKISPTTPKGGTVVATVYFHGNSGNADWSIPMGEQISNAFGCDVYILDYPHYGKSSQRLPLDEQNVYQSGDELIRWLKQEKDIPLLLVGMSMGGCVATRCATTHHCPYLITINSPSSFAKIAQDKMPLGLKWIASMVDEFPSYLDIEDFSGKGILIHCPDDELVPISHSIDMTQKNKNLRLLEVPGTHMHPDIKWDRVKTLLF